VVLVVLDVVLVVAALGINRGSAGATPTVTRVTDASSAPGVSSSPEPSTTGSASPSPSPSPSVSTPSATPAPAAAVPVERLLVAIDDRRAYRVTTGTCANGGAAISVTSDGGASWDPRPAPLASISRLIARPGSAVVYAVGAGTDCVATLQRSADRGESWTQAAPLADYFAIDPRRPGSVAIPGRGTVEACSGRPVLDLAVDGGTLRVLCAGGRLRSTGAGATGWTDGPSLPGAVALTTTRTGPPRTYVARVGRPNCRGVDIVDVENPGDPIGCLRRVEPVEPGSVSLSIPGSAGWLLVGGDLSRADETLGRWARR
jgi:hypothetical protein